MSGFFNWRGHAYLGLASRTYLALIFLLACYHKIVDPQSFALDVATYQILPLGLVNLTALILPWVELVAAGMLLIGWRTPPDLAMTGELTLVGEVLPIGGVREKVLAAKRYGLKRVILPSENRSDIEELNEDLVRGLRFIHVDCFEEVAAEVFRKRRSR